MAVQTLNPSNLKYNETGDEDWASESMNYNTTLLNSTLLKLREILDVDDSGLQDQDGLCYNTSSQKWERRSLPAGFRELTTTTTTTSTTTTSSTTSTT